MNQRDRHLDDRELLRCLDAEQTPPEHLARCWTCRSRLRELEALTGEIVHLRDHLLLPGLDDAPPLRPAAAIPPPAAPRPIRWRAVAGLAAMLAAFVLLWPFRQTSVQAALRQSIEAERALTARLPRPVVKQSLRLRRVMAGQVRETSYVSWVELPSGRWRTEGGDAGLMGEAAEMWRSHHLRFDQPLSAAAFGAAFDGELVGFEDGRLVAARGPRLRAEMMVRPGDWHVTAAVLDLGDRRYEVTEDGLDVDAWAVRYEAVFAPLAVLPGSPVPARPELASAHRAPAPKLPESPLVVPDPPVAAFEDLDVIEVEVWHAIYRGGCLRGCEIEIGQEAGRVTVRGTTASEPVRQQLLAVLGNLPGAGRISVRVSALDRAAARRPAPDLRTRLEAAPLPIEAFLRETASSEPRIAVAALANSVIALADRAEQHNRLLRRLLGAFPPGRYQKLPARSQWLLDGMALENVQALRLAINGLQDLQQPVFAQLKGPSLPAPVVADPWAAFESTHDLLHALYAGASDTAPVEGVREVAARLAALERLLANEYSNEPFRSPRR